MFPTHLLFQVTKPQVQGLTIEKQCCSICGAVDYCLPKKEVIKKTFTNRDLLRFDSEYVCQACAYALSKREYRNNSLVVTKNEVKLIKQQELKSCILEPLAPPFFICVAVSRKKWLHIRTRVNYSQNKFYVQFEEQGILIDRGVLRQALNDFETLLSMGFGKGELLSGELYSWKLSKQDNPYCAVEIYEKIKPYVGSSFLSLVSFIAVAEEVKKFGNTKRKTKSGCNM